MAGLPASGKSTEALRLAVEEGGVRVRSDVERKRHRDPLSDPYGAPMSDRTYGVLLGHARSIVEGGLNAVLDATYLRRSRRLPVLELARELGVPFKIIHCDAPFAVLRERIRSRLAEARDPSQADEKALRILAAQWEPFNEEEERHVERRVPAAAASRPAAEHAGP
jgi:predicted kinase